MFAHLPVLLGASLGFLAPRAGGLVVDCTLGGGGHAESILEASAPDGRLIGIDRDPEAIAAASSRLSRFGDRVRILRGRASELSEHLDGCGWGAPQAVFFDFGVSSPQIDNPARGFSFQAEGPLDMRMDPSLEQSADSLVNSLEFQDLARLLRVYGEEPKAGRIAQAIVAARPIHSTLALARLIEQAVGGRRGARVHPATRSFLALRLVVNAELDQVRSSVRAALDRVGAGGRVVCLSYHSLEDRIVKQLFAEACGIGTPRDGYGHPLNAPEFRRLTSHALKAEGLDDNPRARSVRLRAVERCGAPDTERSRT